MPPHDEPARLAPRLAAAATDALCLAAALALTAAIAHPLRLPTALTTISCGLVAVVLISWWWAAQVRWGRGPGHLLLGLRSIDPATGMPGRRPRFTAINVRHRDPLRPTARPVRLDAVVPLPARETLILVGTIDDGRQQRLIPPCVIGRDPHVSAPLQPVAMPDIGRSVSRSHALLTLDNGDLLIKDLASTNGTRLLTPQGPVPLTPNMPMRLALRPGQRWQLRLGDRHLTIDAFRQATPS